jgi:hypothetical protein
MTTPTLEYRRNCLPGDPDVVLPFHWMAPSHLIVRTPLHELYRYRYELDPTATLIPSQPSAFISQTFAIIEPYRYWYYCSYRMYRIGTQNRRPQEVDVYIRRNASSAPTCAHRSCRLQT